MPRSSCTRSTRTRTAPRNTSTDCWRSASPPRRSSAAVSAVIAAAGSGERLGAGVPKAFVPLAGRPMVAWSLAAFAECEGVEAIVVAVPPSGHHPDHEQVGPAAVPTAFVAGGATRAESVSNALRKVGTELVAIHDAARPLVTAELLQALVADLDATPEADAVIAASSVTDTVKRSSESIRQLRPSGGQKCRIVDETVDRSTLWAAQTPQVFRTEALRVALQVDEAARNAATDEAMLIEAAGGTVLLHEVTAPNLKVTTPADLKIAELLLNERA